MTDIFGPSFLILALGLIGLGVLFLGIAMNTLVGLLAFFVVDYLYPGNIGSASVRALVLIAILALTLFVSITKNGVAFTSGRRYRQTLPRAAVGMVALFAVVIAASSYDVTRLPDFWSLSTSISVSEFVGRNVLLAMVTSLLLVLTVVQVVHTRERLDKLMRALVLLAVILAVYGLAQYVTGVKFLAGVRFEEPELMRWRLTSITSNTHAHTYYLVLPALYVTYSWLLGRRRRRWGVLTLSAVLLVTLVLSLSRAALIGMVLSGIVFLVISPLNRALKQAATIGAVVLLAAVLAIGFRLSSTEPGALGNPLLGGFVAPGSTSGAWSPVSIDNALGRGGRWRQAIMAVKDRPVLGHGVGTATRVVRELAQLLGQGRYAGGTIHNAYLDWTVDTGLVGAAILALMLFLTIYKLYTVMRRAQRLGDCTLATYACAFLAILPAFMAMDFFANYPGLQLFFLLFALSLVLERLLAKESRRRPEAARPALAATPARA